MIIDGAKPDEPEALILLAAHKAGLVVEFKRKHEIAATWVQRNDVYTGTKFLPDNYYRAKPKEGEHDS